MSKPAHKPTSHLANRIVPFWADLPDYVQNDLVGPGYKNPWFDSQSDIGRLTVLNLYVKLSGLGNLWKHVKQRAGDNPGKGNLEFLATDVYLLRRELAGREPKFTLPDESLNKWECRETRATGALHFKHFKDWSPVNKVQAHIDRIGLYAGAEPASAGVMWVGHGIDLCRKGWEHAFEIRDLLLQQGWDRQPLMGKNAR